MASTFTTNISLEEPGAGDYSGTWNTPNNSNFTVIDLAQGTLQQIDLSGGSVSLSTTQMRSSVLSFIGALSGSVTVTLQSLSTNTSVVSGRVFTVHNRCSNSSAYTVTIQSTVSGSQVICAPPGDATDIMLQGTNSSFAGSVTYRNLQKVGTFWDYAGTAVPNWVSGCTIPPYLNCDGTTFSSATYPYLSLVLGGTTLPDARGRFRATLNQGQSRITSGSSTGGVDGNTNLASGGQQVVTLSSQNMAQSAATVTDTHKHALQGSAGTYVGGGAVTSPTSFSSAGATVWGVTNLSTIGSISVAVGSSSPTNFSILPPTVIAGITMIRAA